MIRLSVPSIEEDDLQAVIDVLRSGYLVQGPQVRAFETKIADYVGSKYAVAVTNCTAALQMALLALDVRQGDMVVVSSYSWISTANVIELCGAQPVFVDINLDTYNICPNQLQEVLRSLFSNRETSRRVKAVLPVHTFGQIADMPSILEVAGCYDLPVVEDAACALGADFEGRKAGNWGVMGCFSFHPRKAVTTGEGGVITTSEEELYLKLQSLRNHGIDPSKETTSFVMPGFNNRMTEFQAALGQTQLSKVDRIIQARRQAARRYTDMLRGTAFVVPELADSFKHVFQSYVILLPEELAHKRTKVVQKMREMGVEVTIGTWHMPMTDYYSKRYGYRKGDFPNTDSIFARSLTLPLFEGITLEQQQYVVDCLLRVGEQG